MGKIKFTDNSGTFVIENPENYSGLYLPLAGEKELTKMEEISGV